MGYVVAVSQAEESHQRRLARNLNELLQELRVAQAGVQILFGFLLSIAFTERYASADGYIRATHLITILFAACAVALLTAPAAWHRLLFRRGRREDVIEVANRFAIIGLANLAVAMVGTILLLAEVVIGGWVAVVVGAFAAVLFGTLWFAWPWRERSRDTIRNDDVPDEDRVE
ncbi:hypothetical protein IOD16_09025 [Saccharothrix sp. 6-C]|uniref:Sodium:proton antiporter n=1 Tax=Saccharothrix texasensis TaxID=103734 RepID=A0A3N1H2N2_9PSEU|nr:MULTISPECIES: DUF6328 family protein [Saccharothrix]QQQ78574.1 hypothetical protein IOD16_09025 [Saccharothrix sp. 6-C]ROP36748.1 hypothetical protein EDD40_2025 [Saccharothrix texasensis]